MAGKRSITVWLLTMLLAGTGWPALAATSLERVSVDTLQTGQVTVELGFNEPLIRFSDKLIYHPSRLLLHLPQTRNGLATNPVAVARQGVRQVLVTPVEDGLDVAVELEQLLPYRIRQEGNRLLVTLGQAASQPKPSGMSPAAAATVKAATRAPVSGLINRITSLDFRRGKEGQGQLLVGLESSAAAMDISSRGNHVLAKFHATEVSDALQAILDVTDFATPVTKVDVSRSGSSVLLDLNVKGAFDYRYDQADNLFIIEVSPRKEAKPGQAAKSYGGKPISLNFQDVPVRTVLQLIADFNHFNLVTTDSVGGNITLRLDGVPWEQALDTVLKVRGLDKRLENNILLVAPAEEIAAREKQALESRQQVADLAPLHTELVQINYAKAREMAELLSQENTRLLSSRGAVSVDERTNTLLIKDTNEVLAHVKQMLKVLDVPVKQVVIEARMVTIDDGLSEALGVRWGATKVNSDGGISGSIEANDSGLNGNVASVDQRLNVNLPVNGAAGQLALQVAKLADGTLLDLELSALEQENKAEIIASPRVTTANQKAASIVQGTQIPYVESSSSGATSVAFKDAVLSLKVTPQITPDNRIILDLIVTQDTVGDVVPTSTGSAVAINTQKIETQVLVDNGETLVLGGIYQQTIKKDVYKVPVLGDIPGVGVLFKNTSEQNTKRELLIFVTPKIVTERL